MYKYLPMLSVTYYWPVGWRFLAHWPPILCHVGSQTSSPAMRSKKDISLLADNSTDYLWNLCWDTTAIWDHLYWKNIFFGEEPIQQNLSWKTTPLEKNVVSQDRWSLVTGSVVLKCWSFCQNCVVFQDRWSLVAVVSQERFHCISIQ